MSENSEKSEFRNKNQMNDIDLTELKRWLKHGDIVELAVMFGMHRNAAYRILSGSNKNFDFLEAALEKAIANKRKVHLLNQRLNAISSDPAV